MSPDGVRVKAGGWTGGNELRAVAIMRRKETLTQLDGLRRWAFDPRPRTEA